jgi:Protein of unknown function (DUF2587)
MGTDTKIAVDQPGMTGANPKPPRDKVMRIATMTKQLLDEVHAQPLDTASLHRLLPVTEDDDDGVIGVDEDLDVRTAPLGVMSGAVVGVVTGCPSC